MTTPISLADKLTELASQVEDGVIVEMGSFHGKGTVALAKKAKAPIFTIDDFKEKHGWINERYGPEDEEIFWKAVEEVDATIIQVNQSFDEAAEKWICDIGLLYWDPGMTGRFRDDFEAWSKFVIKGGWFIVKDTAQGHLGTFPIILQAIASREWERVEYWDGVSFLRKLK